MKIGRKFSTFFLPLLFVFLQSNAQAVSCSTQFAFIHYFGKDFREQKTLERFLKEDLHLMRSNIPDEGLHTKMARKAVRYLAFRNDLPAANKAKLWEDMAEIIHEHSPDKLFISEKRESVDDSHVYVGKIGELLVIAPDAKVYRAFQPEMAAGIATWDGQFARLKLVQ